ncbi:MAG: hypothetical protein HYX51_00360 [Chloroflexi bacterium]|nr:hypothetical protein [Chloroflexota bacterium]
MTTLAEVITPDIARFCAEEQIEPDMERVFALIEELFPDARGLRANLVWDPDIPGDVWVSLTVTLSGSIAEIIHRDDTFVSRWIEDIPWPARDKIVVDLDVA